MKGLLPAFADGRWLPLAGFMATAVSFGPARMGFGLFLPTFRDTFHITTDVAGLISSAAFAAFLVALPIGIAVLDRRGPRAPVVLGGLAATLGLAVVAVADGTWTLAAGIVLSASSAGFCWTPYNNAAERIVERDVRARTLSIISTGTTIGTALAGTLALVVAISALGWRVAWGGFAIGALVMTLVNIVALHPVANGPGGGRANFGRRQLLKPKAVPLLIAALSFGMTSAVYLAFAIDHATAAGALAYGPLESAAPILFISFGIFGLVGLATGEIENRTGLVALVRAVFAASAVSFALLGFWADVDLAVLVSAGLQGAVIMTMSAVFSFWSARLFRHIPSVSFTAVLIVVAIGSVLGPAMAGWVGHQIGMAAVFIAGAAMSLATPFLMRPSLIEKASARPWRPGSRSRTIHPAPR